MFKHEMFLYSFHDHTGIRQHLETMAAKGWLLDATGFFWRYRKCQPQTVRYAVTYFPTSSDFDPAPSDKEYMFRDFCEEAGWEFVAHAGEMQIFRSTRPDPTPLDTEPMVQVETIHASMKSSHLKNQAGLVISSGLFILFLLYRLFTAPMTILPYGGYLFALFSEALLIADAAWETASYFRWRKSALAAAEEGRFLPTPGRRWPKVLNQVLVWTLFLALFSTVGLKYLPILVGTLAAILIPVFIARKVQLRMKEKGVPGRTTKLVTVGLSAALALAASFAVIFFISLRTVTADRYEGAEQYQVGTVTHYAYRDALPLYMSDLTAVDDDDYSNHLYARGSFLLKETDCRVHRRFDRREESAPTSLSYTVWTSPLSSVLDLAVEDRLEWYTGRTALDYCYRPISTPSGEVWQLYDGERAVEQYLLRLDTCVIEIDFDFTPTAEQMATAIEKLLSV